MQQYAIFGTGGKWEWNELGYLTTIESDNIGVDLEKIARKRTAASEKWIKAADVVCKPMDDAGQICAHITKVGLTFVADKAERPAYCVNTFTHDAEIDLDEERDTFVAVLVVNS